MAKNYHCQGKLQWYSKSSFKLKFRAPGADKEGDEDEEDMNAIYVYKPPSPRPWMPLGSEFEVDEVQVKPTRRNIKLFCSRKRKFFNSKINFGESEVDCQSIKQISDAPERTNRLQHDTGCQAITTCESSYAQTNRPEAYRNQWIQTKPREASKEQLDKVIESDEIKKELKVVEPLVNLCLQQNHLYNAFDDCWSALGSKDDGFGSKSDGHLREYQSFTDLQFSKDKRLTCIDWHPQIKGYAVLLLRHLGFSHVYL